MKGGTGSAFGRDFLAYLLASIATNAIPLIGFILYIRWFTPEQFGYLSLGTAAASMLGTLLVVGLPQILSRRLPALRSPMERAQLVWSTLGAITGVAAAGLLLYATGVLVVRGVEDGIGVVLLAAIPAAFLSSLLVALESIYAAESRRWQFVRVRLAGRVADLAVALPVVAWLATSPAARFLGGAAGLGIVVAVVIVRLARELGWVRPRRGQMAMLLRASTPLAASSILGVFLSGADRFLLEFIRGPVEVARLGAAATVGGLFGTLLVVPLTVAALPYVVQAWEGGRRKEMVTELRDWLHLYLAVAVGILAFLVAGGSALLELIAGPTYSSEAWTLVTMAAAVLLYGVYYLTWAGVLVTERYKVVTLWTGVALATDMALVTLLAPTLGALGAAIALLAAHAVFVGAITAHGHRVIPVRVHALRLTGYAGLAALLAAAVRIAWPWQGPLSVAGLAVGGAAYLACLAWMERERLGRLFRHAATVQQVGVEPG